MRVICFTVTAPLSEENTKAVRQEETSAAKKMEGRGEICFMFVFKRQKTHTVGIYSNMQKKKKGWFTSLLSDWSVHKCTTRMCLQFCFQWHGYSLSWQHRRLMAGLPFEENKMALENKTKLKLFIFRSEHILSDGNLWVSQFTSLCQTHNINHPRTEIIATVQLLSGNWDLDLCTLQKVLCWLIMLIVPFHIYALELYKRDLCQCKGFWYWVPSQNDFKPRLIQYKKF